MMNNIYNDDDPDTDHHGSSNPCDVFIRLFRYDYLQGWP